MIWPGRSAVHTALRHGLGDPGRPSPSRVSNLSKICISSCYESPQPKEWMFAHSKSESSTLKMRKPMKYYTFYSKSDLNIYTISRWNDSFRSIRDPGMGENGIASRCAQICHTQIPTRPLHFCFSFSSEDHVQNLILCSRIREAIKP